MTTSIKAIDDKSIHLIQSGQVIVDLCSVVKELVENSIDSGANIVDVRFKNQGLDQIEVQDNGCGISPANHSSIALKHYTSKLSSYSDIDHLKTFGFRGEALASLCAVSKVIITTCTSSDAPRGFKLSFESSGKLSSSAVAAAQRGTTVFVESLFHNLPVRRREVERNIKREWHKVVALLHQYACIQTNLKFSVSQQPTKGKRILLFSTKGNSTTRENILNIFGSKATSTLVPIDILVEMESSKGVPAGQVPSQTSASSKEVRIKGHVSKPTNGAGRQTPDRQMFFVNGRPCGLPQFARAFNEVYRSYNYSQSPFIFADIQLNTNMYDVNVSPDKRSILLHDQASLLDNLRLSLIALFDSHEHSLPTADVSPQDRLDASTTFQKNQRRLLVYPNTEGGSLNVAEAAHSDKPASDGADKKIGDAAETVVEIGTNTYDGSPGVGHLQSSLSKWLNRDVVRDPSHIFRSPTSQPNQLTLDRRNLQANKNSKNICEEAQDMPSKNSSVRCVSSRGGTRQQHDLHQKSSETMHDNFSFSSKQSAPPILAKTVSKSRDDKQGCRTTDVSKIRASLSVDCDTSNSKAGSELAGADIYQQGPAEHNQSDENTYATDLLDVQTPHPISIDGWKASLGIDSPQSYSQQIIDGPKMNVRDIILSGDKRKFGTAHMSRILNMAGDNFASLFDYQCRDIGQSEACNIATDVGQSDTRDIETSLSLIISKNDFANMRLVGQFNLGFIIAVRPRSAIPGVDAILPRSDELFIIDQHASDEKYNFEKLQTNTIVQSQRLVRPKTLSLTALEEEITIGNLDALEANGFQVDVDSTCTAPVGSRCQLLALPLSREITFTLKDLEELISLLADEPAGSKHIPRPSTTRKMFAMRACRSSVMIGKALTESQMYTIMRHMGELDKPWNCPHGRPTMRHLCRIQAWDEAAWSKDIHGALTLNSWVSYTEST